MESRMRCGRGSRCCQLYVVVVGAFDFEVVHRGGMPSGAHVSDGCGAAVQLAELVTWPKLGGGGPALPVDPERVLLGGGDLLATSVLRLN